MTAYVLRGTARRVPLPDGCVDLILTSPPYFQQRSYKDGGEHYEGQIGSEPTPAEYLAALLECTGEMARVLKPSGSLFINLGDKYSQRVQVRRSSHQPGFFPGKFPEFGESWAERAARGSVRMPQQNIVNGNGFYVPEKSLMALPWRFAIRCVDELGLILRRDIVWHKTSGMPESVTDRAATTHEYLFHFVKCPRYYSAVDEIREPHAEATVKRAMPHRSPVGRRPASLYLGQPSHTLALEQMTHPLGKLPGSVWPMAPVSLIPPPHLDVDHHAHFPPELCRRVILGWSPAGVCTGCGQGRRPVVETAYDTQGRTTNGPQSVARRHESPGRDVRAIKLTTITGYTCACPAPGAPAHPGIVFDPFGGSGTTALVADVLGRTGITMDLSHDYGRLARWRITDPAERARAMGVPKPPPVTDGQGELFDPCGEAS